MQKQDVDKQVQALIDEIDRNPNLTDKEKQALKDRINQILQQGHNDINNAMTKEEIACQSAACTNDTRN